jgi:hypothetical protein
MTNIDHCKIINLQKIERPQGNITPVCSKVDIPFDIQRVYYLYDVPGGSERGGHAHRQLEQLVVAAMGSFDIILDDGQRRKTVNLNRSYYGLYIPHMIWREIVNFSTGAVSLVLASLLFNEADYIRAYQSFTNEKSADEYSIL